MPKTAKKKPVTAGQRKLASLNVDLPLYPTTLVGSLPKQSELVELKNRVSKGFAQQSELERKEKLSIDHWIRYQESLGFDVLVDGEINRGDFITYFSEKIGGYEQGGLVRCYGNRYYKKPIIKGKLEWKEPLVVESWRSFQRTTHKPLKAIVTGPYTLADWSFNEYYPSREKAVRDLSEILHKEMIALHEAGAKIIQIDEPALSSRPNEFSMVADALKTVIGKIPCYFILHHSYGDLTPIWSKMQKLPVDNFDIETTNSNFSVLPLLKKIPTKKDLTLGIIESHSHLVESPRQISDRIKQIFRYVPRPQVWFSPDCGLKSRKSDEAMKKMTLFTKAAKAVRLKHDKK